MRLQIKTVSHLSLAASLLLVAASGCVGTIDGAPTGEGAGEAGDGIGAPGTDGTNSDPSGGGPGSEGDPGDGSGEGGGGAAPDLTPPDCTTTGPRLLRRLTARQFRHTLEALFRDPNVPEAEVLTDPVVNGFQVDATATVIRDLDAQQLMQYAEKVAAWAVETKLGQLSSCQTDDAGCRRDFIQGFGSRVYREPMAPEAVDAYEALMAGEESFAEGAELVIAAMLQSPYLLYRRELGEPDPNDPDTYLLSPYEVASNLAYTLTDGPPDDALRAAAEQGRLTTREDLDRELNRLLATPDGRETMDHFLAGWLEYDDLPGRAKDEVNGISLTAELREDMMAETGALFADLLDGGGTVADLFTASHSFLNQRLGAHYQIWEVGGESLQRVELAAGNRAPGILGHGSILARHALSDSSSPVQRGLLVRQRLLCQTVAPPPPEVDANLTEPEGAVTTRQRYEQHTTDEQCSVCHAQMDPIGFAFEHYDTFGRRREQESGIPIDATGEVVGVTGGPVALDGLESLSEYLATSDRVSECFVQYLSYFAYGLDQCNQDTILEEATAAGGTLKDMLRGIVFAPHFTRRSRVEN